KGFNIADENTKTLERGQVRVAGNGGMVLYYIGEHDAPTAAHLVEALQQSDFAGIILTREQMPGTFALALAHVDIEPGPDVLMSFRWNDHVNSSGVAGMIYTSAGTDTNKAT